ncbi:hypothetical protein FOA52_001332 [Chlamydomonas sp. UWO 241]|nr:hypothetical protein FOA52_001332 [Chlamydomonas sp. UWO 241]
MANLNKRYDVAVIDEIQMIGDAHRGSAWSRALLGLPAEVVHVCGDFTALPLLRAMCAETGDELEVKEYERAGGPIEVEKKGISGLRDIQAGDCVVVFSKERIYWVKKLIEDLTPHKVCVVYGALPSDTRREQAHLFNDPSSGYDVLVATDAVGMGLNLNIRRVVFQSLSKPSGETDPLDPSRMLLAPLSDSAIKQIAGRAGRRNSQYASSGAATMLGRQRPMDIHTLRDAMAAVLAPLEAAGLFPEPEYIEALAASVPDASFKQVVDAFLAATTSSLSDSSQLGGSHYALCKPDTLASIAELLEPLSVINTADKLRLCMAPVRMGIEENEQTFLHFVSRFAAGVLIHPPRPTLDPGRRRLLDRLRQGDMSNRQGLALQSILDAQAIMGDLEKCHQTLSLWMWLALRFPECGLFVGRGIAAAEIEAVEGGLARLLELLTGTKLPYSSRGGGGLSSDLICVSVCAHAPPPPTHTLGRSGGGAAQQQEQPQQQKAGGKA